MSLAKVTTRMLLAVATPTHMIDPISAGTLSVVCARKRIQQMPAMAPGSAMRMTSGSSQDWKFTTINRYTSRIAKISPYPRPRNEDCMLSACPLICTVVPRGIDGLSSSTIFCTRSATEPRSVPSTLACTSYVLATL